MKMRTLITLAVVSVLGGWLAMPNGKVLAQDGATCTGRCETRFTICQSGAEAALEVCLDRAENARAKANCAKAFTKLEDACREAEASCLSDCGS